MVLCVDCSLLNIASKCYLSLQLPLNFVPCCDFFLSPGVSLFLYMGKLNVKSNPGHIYQYFADDIKRGKYSVFIHITSKIAKRWVHQDFPCKMAAGDGLCFKASYETGVSGW